MFGNNYNNPYNYGGMPFGYNPNATYPNYIGPTQPAPTSTTNTNKIFVTGIEGARNQMLSANSDYMFLDNDKPILYEKIVDSKGQFEVKAFDISPHKEEKTSETVYVLKSDFDKLYSEFIQVKEKLSKLGGINEPVKEQITNEQQQPDQRNVELS